MWFHLDHRQEKKPHYHWRLVAVATAEHPNGTHPQRLRGRRGSIKHDKTFFLSFSTPQGPFHLHHAFHPSGLPSLDITLYQLPADDGVGNKAHEAFLVRAIDNKYIGASKLRSDFLDVVSRCRGPRPTGLRAARPQAAEAACLTTALSRGRCGRAAVAGRPTRRCPSWWPAGERPQRSSARAASTASSSPKPTAGTPAACTSSTAPRA